MTVYNELNKIAYIGSSEQTLYPIPFEYINTDDIKVSVYTSNNEFVEDWTYSTQYVIEGGNVKVLSGYNIDNTKKLLVLRRVDLIQDNKYREGGDFPAKSTETSFDKLTMITQQLQETLDRCVKVEVLDIQTPEELLQTVYDKLDSATEIAGDTISAANQAQTAADNATAAVNSAEQTLVQTQAYVDSAKVEIDNTKNTAINTINSTVTQAKADINSAVSTAESNISTIVSDAEGSITNIAVTEANKVIANAAQEATDIATANVNNYVDGTVKPSLQTYVDQAQADANSAATSMEQAALSATAASNYASNASADADNAAESAGLAAESAAAAATSETNAKASETNVEATKAEVEAIAKLASFGNIGDIKYTSRTDVPNGGAWCDGALYTKAQFPDVYQMLVDGKLQSTTVSEFDSSVSANGSCGFFGLDTANERFKVPMLKDVYLKAGQVPSMFGAESLPNIIGGLNNTAYVNGSIAKGAFSTIATGGHLAGTTSATDAGGWHVKFSASNSSSVYQDGAKVNPDHVVYRAYVVLYSSAAESSSVIKDYEIYNTVPLLTPLFHPEEISDTNWLKSEGQWNHGNIYEAVYNELTSDYAHGTNKTDNIGGITISYRLTPKKRRICLADQDANVTALFEATGIAWYYVLDNSLSRFKLPRSKYAFVGNRDNVGGYVAESLPNITGHFAISATYGAGVKGTGVFTGTTLGGTTSSPNTGTKTGDLDMPFSASNSSSVYQDGASVQQRSVEAYLYFKVGNATVNAQLVNVGNITNALTSKADDSAVVHKDLEEVITGWKYFRNSQNPIAIFQTDIIDSSTAHSGSSTKYSGIEIQDTNGIRIGKFEVGHSASNVILASLSVGRKINGEMKYKNITVSLDSSGNGWYENLRPNYGSLVGLGMKLETAKTMPADGVLFINVRTGSQNNSQVQIFDGSGHAIGVSQHNGGSAEYHTSTFTAIVARGQSINCSHNGAGTAKIVSSYLAPWR